MLNAACEGRAGVICSELLACRSTTCVLGNLSPGWVRGGKSFTLSDHYI